MTIRGIVALAALTTLPAFTARGAAAPKPAAPVPAPVVEKDPASGVALRGMMWRLVQTMKGRPVIAVGYGDFREDIPWSDEAFARAQTDLEKLQIISAKNSGKDDPLIPFKVGSAYAVAPQTRDGANPDLAALSAFEVAGRGLLLADTLTRLTPDELKALGSEQGLAVGSLPEEMRRAVARAFRPPLEIVTYKTVNAVGDDGLPTQNVSQESAGELTAPVDWTQARVRARLRMQGVSLSSEGAYGFINSGAHPERAFAEANADRRPWQDRGVDLPLFPRVPNTFKSSDLTGKSFTQPLGLSGVWNVKQVVERLAKATGLTLTAWKPYEGQPVFIGSESISAGDVLDGLRLALTASWRKIGNAYYLAWDRLPLLAIQQAALESADTATRAVKKQGKGIAKDPAWLDIVETLPFDPNDPFALTPEQRERLLTARDEKPGAWDAGIPFQEMTPEQQKTVRARAARERISTYVPNQKGPPQSRPYNDDDLRATKMMSSGAVEISLQVPGQGWVAMASDQEGLSFSASQLQRARETAAPETAKDPMDEIPEEIRTLLEKPEPVTLPSALRGLVVPTLPPARLNELADEMERHGLNVLFYPALYGGYATVPGTPFPLDPALRDADGLAAAVAAMKPKDIRVVAYLNTLAWQNDEDPVHWLNKHPDWLDVDVLGRGRLAWVKAHPEAGPSFPGLVEPPYNYVRPAEPQVEARLKALLKTLSARKDVGAVAFAATTPSVMPDFMGTGLTAPPLGYAMADRLAVFQKTGDDPADAVSYNDYVPESVRALGGYSSPADMAAASEARAALIGRLFREIKTLRPDWRAYLLKDSISTADFGAGQASPAAKDAPKPDLTIANIFTAGPSGAVGQGVVLPITRRNFFDAMAEADDTLVGTATLDRLKSISPMVIFQAIFTEESALKNRVIPMALYDFRDAPDLITDSLKWVKAPGKPVAP